MAESFWADYKVEPKRKFRWILHLDHIPAWTIKKVTKPSYTISEIKHSFINHSFYYPGRVEYNEVEFTLVDPVEPDAAASLLAILTGMGYVIPDAYEVSTQTITKEAATQALGEVRIQQMGGLGLDGDVGGPQILETWTLKNCWVKEINLGDLEYESDDISEITVKLRYDWAEFEGGDPKSSAPTARMDI